MSDVVEDTQEEEGRPSETAVLTASRGDLSPCRGAARDLFLGWGWWGGLQAPQSLCDLLGLSFFWSPGLDPEHSWLFQTPLSETS